MPQAPALAEGMTSEETGTPAGTVYLYRIRSPFGYDTLYGYADCSSASGLKITAECNGVKKEAPTWPYEWSFAKFGYNEPAEVNISIAKDGATLKTLSQTLRPESTGVENLTNVASRAAKGIYTIDGIRIESITKPGFYIVDGKKVIKR